MAAAGSRLNAEAARDVAVAIAAVAVGLAVSLGLDRLLGMSPQVSVLLCTIMFVAWARGIRAAVLAAALAILSFAYLAWKPAYSLQADLAVVPRLLFFAVAAVFVVALSAAHRRAADSLRRARDEQRAMVREQQRLNEALSGENAERKRAEQALRLSEARLAAAIDTIPVLVASYGPDGRRDFVNAAWKRYTGLSQEQALGTEWLSTVHPDDIAVGEIMWREALAKGEALHIEQRFRRADGTYRWFLVDRVPLHDENGRLVKWYSTGYDIEDQMQAENALRRSEAQLAQAERELRLTLNSIPTMAWHTRADGYAEYLNKRWLDYTGLAIDQARGCGWQVTIHPEDLAGLIASWQEMLASEQPKEVEARMRRFDGRYRWFMFRPDPLRDESGKVVRWYGTNTDIEDRKRAETALQRSEAYLAEAQKVSLTGSFGWAVLSGEIYWSEEAYNIMGYDRTITPSIDAILQRVHPEDQALLLREIDRVLNDGQTLDFEHRLLMPDGQIKYLRVLGHRVRYVTGQEEMIGALVDITAAKRAEEALHAAQTNLAHASRVATLGEISASIAHEVNQPLAAIISNAQACLRFLRSEAPDLNDVQGTVEWILKAGDRASEVIQRLRALMNKSEPQLLPLDVNEIVGEVLMLLQRELATRRVSVQVDLAAGLPVVAADRIQLQQVIINLVMNGIEAMQSADQRVLTIRSHQDAACQVVVAVIDRGVGVAEEDSDRLFDAFFSTKPGGLGMGLSICRSIVEAHGGLIEVSANADLGATFQFSLPARRAAASDEPRRASNSVPAQDSAAIH